MIDRNVEFPNRFQLQKVPGTDDIYDIIPAPGDVIAPGDLFSKGNMLPDSIPKLLGLKMSNPQVADALNVLANIGNLHVWKRVQTYTDPVPEVPAGYTLGEVEENVAVTGISSSQVGLYVGDSISVDSDGNVTINNEQYHFNNPSGAINGWYGSSYSTLLAGKFCRVENSTRYTTLVSGVFYVPVGTTLVNPNNNTLTIPSLQRVTGYPYTPAIPAGTTTDYLTSTDRNAYTEGTVGNTTITYLGQLGGGARIEVGSYVGTGTYGSSNPCYVTASFPIKQLSVFGTVYADTGNYFPTYQASNNSSYSMHDILLTTSFASQRGIHKGTSSYNLNYSFGKKSVDGRTFWWYSSGNNASFQLNESAVTYYYIAIG